MKRGSIGLLPAFTPMAESDEPLYLQVDGFLRGAILRGDLPAGRVLPSTRAMAAHLRVSRNTIVTAYETLAADGLIEGRRGAGTRVQPLARSGGGIPRIPEPGTFLRAAQFPVQTAAFLDADGNVLYLNR